MGESPQRTHPQLSDRLELQPGPQAPSSRQALGTEHPISSFPCPPASGTKKVYGTLDMAF